jgi:hypothetical protein
MVSTTTRTTVTNRLRRVVAAVGVQAAFIEAAFSTTSSIVPTM